MRDKVTFVKYGVETNYDESHLIVRVAPGGGTPLHYHMSYNETFGPIKGSLGVHIDGEEKDVPVGEEVTVPKAHVHCFRNRHAGPPLSSTKSVEEGKSSALPSEQRVRHTSSSSRTDEKKEKEDANTPHDNGDVEFHCILRPSHPGFERSLYVLYGLAKDGLVYGDEVEEGRRGVPKDFITTCLVMTMSDMALPGWGWKVFDPVMKGVAAWARWMGYERELFERYCS